MDAKDFRQSGYAAIDFVADYLENIRERQVLPSVELGYLHDLLPSVVPEKPECWKDVMQDVNEKIMPGITHWQSPNFHAYSGNGVSYPSILGELVSDAFGVLAFSWISCPAATELEVIVMNSLGKLLNLPEEFLNCSEGPGGGVIQGSSSEAILVAVLTAREQSVKRLKSEHLDLTEGEIRAKLVVYSSDQCNGAVEKAALLAGVEMRLLPVDNEAALRGDTLKKAVDEDISNGRFPIACIATLGTTQTCAFDNLNEIGPICRENNIWLHIDAAYAGSALCCPEFHYLMPGIEFSDSLSVSLNKGMKIHFESGVMWLKDSTQVVDALTVDRIYLKHNYERSLKAPEYRNWSVGLSRRFRAMKIWFALRIMGAEKIRENIRNEVRLAAKFAELVSTDDRFEIVGKPTLGLVCFRLKGECKNTQCLLNNLSERKKIYLVSAELHNHLVLRFINYGFEPKEKDIEFAWNEIKSVTDEMMSDGVKTETHTIRNHS